MEDLQPNPAETPQTTYPTGQDLLTLLGVFLVATVVAALLTSLLTHFGSVSVGFSTFLAYLIQFGTTICFGLYQRYRRAPGTSTLSFRFRMMDFPLALLGVVLISAVGVAIEPILMLFPQNYLDSLMRMMGSGGWMMFTAIVVAPVFEEVLFRGLLQGALTTRYGGWRGILLASAVFGVVHLIPQQVINAFFVALVLGDLYHRTRSLSLVILIHMINNAIAYFMWMVTKDEEGASASFTLREWVKNDTLYYTLYAVACMVVVVAFVVIVRRIKQDEIELIK